MVRACLARHWGLSDARVEPHQGGMGSATWVVTHGGRRWVAKAVVPALGPQLAGGLSVATMLEAAGIPACAPMPTLDGSALVELEAASLALLSWVEGEPLTGAGIGDQRMIGEKLALVHQALRGASIRRTAAEHFRMDASGGRCGLIDWIVALQGPLLYDLASAVMYVGGPDHRGRLVEAYLRREVVTATEVERALPVMLRFRWAVQADYFAWRVLNHDLTGIAGRRQ